MGRLFLMMGKSSTGKDSIYAKLLGKDAPKLKGIVPYTTRPIRKGERDGVDYHFCSDERRRELEEAGLVVELRSYFTIHGRWDYFTVDDGQIDWEGPDCIMIGTPEAFLKLKAYYKNREIIPIYIEVEDGVRLLRAVERERRQQHPKYEELCRRFLSDSEDFSPEILTQVGITRSFFNEDVDKTAEEIADYISKGQF